jgi:hypothetical protein
VAVSDLAIEMHFENTSVYRLFKTYDPAASRTRSYDKTGGASGATMRRMHSKPGWRLKTARLKQALRPSRRRHRHCRHTIAYALLQRCHGLYNIQHDVWQQPKRISGPRQLRLCPHWYVVGRSEGRQGVKKKRGAKRTALAGLDNTLDRLPRAEDAPFDSFAKQHEPACLPDTRVALLHEIYSWADSQDERCIFWLSGLAGTGKSTIARTVSRRYRNEERLAASFFFSRGGGDVGHADKFVTSIAVQLAYSVPAVKQQISDAIAKRDDIASKSLRDQWQHLVLRPLSKLHTLEPEPKTYVVVVDALDECDGESNIHIIIQLLAEARLLMGVRLRVLLTSRPEVPIRHGFRQIVDSEHMDVVLHNISPSIVNHDIGLFLEDTLQSIGRERCLRAGWPGAEIIVQLVQGASGLFIWAATACRFIRDGKRFAAKRLDTILSTNSNTVAAPEKHLNEIYVTVLRSSLPAEYTDEEREEHCDMLRYVVGSIVVLLSPLSAGSLSALLNAAEEDISQTLQDLHAILNMPKDPAQPIRLHHPSFRDFLLDKQRCGDNSFWVDEKQAHKALAHNCIILMSSSLKQDICGIGVPGALLAEMEPTLLEQCLPKELQYACLYWIKHLAKSGAKLCDNNEVHTFLKKHCLHWIEALGWMGKVSEGIHAISSLELITQVSHLHHT